MNLTKINRILFLPFIIVPILFLNNNLRELGSKVYFFVFFPFILFVFILSLLKNKKSIVKIQKNLNESIYTLVLLMLVFFNYNVHEFAFFWYLVSLFLILLFTTLFDIKIKFGSKNYVYLFVWLYFLINIYLIITNKHFLIEESDNLRRFNGLFLSSSVLGVMSICLYLFYLKVSYTRGKVEKLVIYILLIIIVFESKSRIDLGLTILLPIYLFLVNKKLFKFYKKKNYLILLSFLIFFYPIYTFIKIYYTSDFRSNTENSDNSRIFFSLRLYDNLVQSNFIQLLFGHGANKSLFLLPDRNIMPHNDYLRLLYDYGILFLIFLFKKIYSWFRLNPVISYMILVYLTAFYHNMVFDMYILMLILFSTRVIQYTPK